MRVGIVGAGFTGLTAAFRLVNQGFKVELFEASDFVGGLAGGFSLKDWNWSVEYFYHHIFTNDHEIINLSREIGKPAVFFRPLTSLYFQGSVYPFDSPTHLLKFPHLSVTDKLRMAATLGFIKLNPIWKPLERVYAHEFLAKTMGNKGYKAIWEPLLQEKFGPWSKEVSAAWFWARIQKRTSRLGYFKGGFQSIADRLKKIITSNGGIIHLKNPVLEVKRKGKVLMINSKKGERRFEKVLMTSNTSTLLKIVKNLPLNYRRDLLKLKYLDSLVVILVLDDQLMKDVYWLNIIDQELPFVVMVEHTNMINPKFYGNKHIIYLGAYLPSTHEYLKLSQSELLRLAIKQMKKISSSFKEKSIVSSFIFHKRDTQPVIPRFYSLQIPDFVTPINNLFLANMSMVYPWDRGTNYAVELGERAAKIISE